jgi:hypothetical protein
VNDLRARSTPVFTIDDRVYRWDDVVEYAGVTGDWDSIVAAASAGLAADTSAVQDADVDAAAQAFRRERRLVSADELQAWLEARGLTVDDWLGYVRRTLARESDDLGAFGAPAGNHETWVEAMCSGTLDMLAVTLATRLAVAPDTSFAELEAAFDAFSIAAATDDAIAREVASARLDWLRVEYATARFADEDAAAEAALCVREDGDALDAVATRAGAELEERYEWLEEIDARLAPLLVAARPGEVVGPLPTLDGSLVAEVRCKTTVDVEDPEVRERAAAAVAEQAASRLVTERVVWHDEL